MGKVRVTINDAAVKRLENSRALESVLVSKAEAIAAACNAESSWGGFKGARASQSGDLQANVWSYARQDRSDRTERAKRMIRNLDAE